MSVSRIFSRSFSLWWKFFLPLLLLAIFATFPSLIFQYLITPERSQFFREPIPDPGMGPWVPGILLVFLFLFFWAPFAFGGVYRAAQMAFTGEEVAVQEALTRALSVYWKIMWTNIVLFAMAVFFLLGFFLLAVLPAALIFAFRAPVFGLLLFYIFLIALLFVFFLLAPPLLLLYPVIVVEAKGGMSAIFRCLQIILQSVLSRYGAALTIFLAVIVLSLPASLLSTFQPEKFQLTTTMIYAGVSLFLSAIFVSLAAMLSFGLYQECINEKKGKIMGVMQE